MTNSSILVMVFINPVNMTKQFICNVLSTALWALCKWGGGGVVYSLDYMHTQVALACYYK